MGKHKLNLLVTVRKRPCQDLQQVRRMSGQDPPGGPHPQELEEEEEPDRGLERRLQEQWELDKEQEAPAVEECGDFTLTIHPELRLAQSQFWSCPSSSLPACSCFTSGASTTGPRLHLKPGKFSENNISEHQRLQ